MTSPSAIEATIRTCSGVHLTVPQVWVAALASKLIYVRNAIRAATICDSMLFGVSDEVSV